MILVSVIIPYFRKKDYIKSTIKSILKTNKDHNNKFSNTKKVKIDISLNKSYKTNHIKHKKTRKHKPSN